MESPRSAGHMGHCQWLAPATMLRARSGATRPSPSCSSSAGRRQRRRWLCCWMPRSRRSGTAT
eukprot:3348788-Alexandrium_andersonii.AAC.1